MQGGRDKETAKRRLHTALNIPLSWGNDDDDDKKEQDKKSKQSDKAKVKKGKTVKNQQKKKKVYLPDTINVMREHVLRIFFLIPFLCVYAVCLNNLSKFV